MRMTMTRYINKKLDGVRGEIPQLKHMLKKSFTAPNFRLFWNYWNPIYSYVLTYYVYKPFRKIMPVKLARTFTFVVNGIFHDLVVSLLLKRVSYLVTILFVVYAGLLLIEDQVDVTIKKTSHRVFYNMLLLFIPFITIIWLQK